MVDNVITLLEPIEFGSEKITELTFAKLTAKQMRIIKSEVDWDTLLKIAAMLTNITDRLMDTLSVHDTIMVVEHTAFLLKSGPSIQKDALQF